MPINVFKREFSDSLFIRGTGSVMLLRFSRPIPFVRRDVNPNVLSADGPSSSRINDPQQDLVYQRLLYDFQTRDEDDSNGALIAAGNPCFHQVDSGFG